MNNHIPNYHSNKSVPKQHPPRSAFKQQKSLKKLAKDDSKPIKLTTEDSKSANLFDNIHNLLLNPQKSRATSEVKKGTQNNNIKLLEDKIKCINDKLGLK